MSETIPYEHLNMRDLVEIFAAYVIAVHRDSEFDFQIDRAALVTEIERMAEWLREHKVAA